MNVKAVRRLLTASALCACLVLQGTGSIRAAELFPAYPVIAANVAFWRDVYGKYTTRQGVLHDSLHLDIVYEVIPLDGTAKRSDRAKNRKRVKGARTKWRNILSGLANGRAPASSEERRVHKLFLKRNMNRQAIAKAIGRIRLQKGQKDRFRQGVINSGAYLKRIETIFKNRQLPVDLAYLPHVESSYDYRAYSKFGAAGIWQFTRSTGKRFMKVDYAVDERRDPIIASSAAAKFLKRAYGKFGSWPLAITSYNHGVNGVRRAVKKHGNYQTIFEKYRGSLFGFASRNFYSEFLAAREVAKNYRSYFGPLKLAKPRPSRTVSMPGFVSAKEIMKHFKIGRQTLKILNPALRPPIFEEQKFIPAGYQLRLPDLPRYAKLAERMPKKMFRKRQKRVRFYRVRKGEVVGGIARRLRVSQQSIIMANQLDRWAKIYAGQLLRIPTEKETEILLAALEKSRKEERIALRKAGSVSTAKEKKGDGRVAANRFGLGPEPYNLGFRTVVAESLAVRKEFRKKGKLYGVIKVEGGETVGHYAHWLGTSARFIRKVNGIPFRQKIKMDRPLVIPLYLSNREEFEGKRYEYHKEIQDDFASVYTVEGLQIHTIKRGETIWSLCRSVFGLPLWLVKRYNGDLNFGALQSGQKLKVPVVRKRIAI